MNDDIQELALRLAAAERRELLRLAAARIVDNHEHGRRMADEETLIWARDFVAMNPPLGRPLTPGVPS